MAGKQVNNLAGRKSERGRRPEKEWQKIGIQTSWRVPIICQCISGRRPSAKKIGLFFFMPQPPPPAVRNPNYRGIACNPNYRGGKLKAESWVAANLAVNVGDMSATRRNVANFRADRGNLATWIPVCRHTFVSRFPDIDGPRTDDIRMCVVLIPTLMLI